MSNGSWLRIPLWIPLLVIAFTHNKVHAQFSQEEQKTEYDDLSIQQRQDNFSASVTRPPEVTIIPPLGKTLAVKSGNPAHTGRVCSTWGNFHFKTFDGDIFQFPGLCNYIFASNCKASYEDFNIQIRRSVIENTTLISHVSLKLDGVAIELTRNTTVVNGNPVQLPFSQSGILMQRSNMYLKISAKLGLEFMWNEEDALLVELHEKYANQTCGLCGDFNGISTYNEFVSNNIELTPLQFGNLQKLDGPTEQCEDPVPFETPANCTSEFNAICQAVLTGEAFVSCNELVNVQEYISSCIQDLCHCDNLMAESCMCNTFAEYSRQCAHAGGEPLNWRTAGLCTKSCPFNMQYQECGSPCPDTCTNPERSQLCEDHCTDACLCPPGTVYDDINNSGCIPLEQCYCTYKGETYAPGAKFTSTCTSCTCTEGQWVCVSLSCPGTCSIEGGSHISTFDEKRFTFFGDCNYVLTKLCDSNDFTVLGEIRKCGLTDTETCLKGVTISVGGGQNIIAIKSSGSVFVNTIYTQVPFSAANCTIFKPSSFYMIVHTNYGLQLKIQLVPIMQLYINVEPAHKGLTCGLCGNFNNIQADDFKAASGVIEGTSAAFANTWKTQADCPNVKNNFENPCTLSIENEQYAQHWCGLLTATTGSFAKCHSTVNPDAYYVNCMFDSCNCENSEDCMCAALSTYVKACATKGIQLIGWRAGVCTKYTTTCPKTLTYSYTVDSCEPTCRSLSEPDITCNIQFVPVDGCTCEKGTYMDESGKCVPPSSCPCYYKGSIVSSGEVVHDNGVVCSCTRGKLNCIGAKPAPACKSPMVYFNCTNTTAGVTGAECQKSCQTLDMGCYSTQCLSGCICPGNLVADGQGACIPAEECPCVHNENSYKPGETIKVGCNTCTCKNRQWQCTNESCLATCTVYGDGHYITFDSKRYSFSGDCEYTLVQNYCGMNNSSQGGTFRVITENIPCGTTGTTCSKSIKVFLRNYELILSDGNFEVIQRVPGGEMPFTIRSMGLYLVIDTDAGLIVMWDKKTSVFIKLSPNFKGQVCGLCGNFDGNGINDFTTRSQSVVGDVIEFGNSWKVSPSCPDTKGSKNPCTTNPYRASWAKKQCSIITSAAFANCHSQIEPNEYYEACVTDACACDTGGDCECFCTAVAAYAQKCNEAGICVSWRTPSICPVFCDYYNPKEECEWHYKSCGAPCIKTCRNKSGNCSHELRGLEGCYPNCPDDKPYFNEENMKCVETCGCYDNNRKYYPPGSNITSKENCYSCECTLDGKINCKHDEHACNCTYDGKTYPYHAVIYNTTDGIGACILATCGPNGTINRTVYECPVTTTPFVFTSSTPITTTTVPSTIPLCVHEVCKWSQWYDVHYPGNGENEEDFDTFDNLRAEGYKICKAPKAVECRAKDYPTTPLNELGQKVECNTTAGLICYNKDQNPMKCHNYQIKIYCCTFVPCGYTTTTSIKSTETATTVTETIPPETTTTFVHSTDTPQPTSTKYKTTTLSTSTMTTTTLSTTSVPETTTMTSSILPTTSAKPITTISSTTAACTKEICKWSQWYNIYYPKQGINGGDLETFKNIREKGYSVCETPKNVKCRAVRFPNTSLKDLNQNVTCTKTEGLICYNRDQFPHICLDYEIQIECCKNETTQCPTTLTTKPVVIHTRTTTVPTKHQLTQKQTTKTSTTMETSTKIIVTTHATTPGTTTHKTPPPTIETSTPLKTVPPVTTTSKTASAPTNLPTRATLTTTQAATTSSTPTPTTLISTTTVTVPTRTRATETSPPPTTTETSTEVISTTHRTTVVTTPLTTPPRTTETSTPVTTVPPPTTTSQSPSTTTTLPTSTKTTISTQSTTQTLPHTSTTVTTATQTTTHLSTLSTHSKTTPTTTTQAPSTSTKGTTGSPSTVVPATLAPSTTTTTATTACEPVCTWSKWLDVDFPNSGPSDGDIETYHNIRAAGGKICGQPTHIECRAENFPNISIHNVGQKVSCDINFGLVCKNKEQVGKFEICFNYQVRVRCCTPNPICSSPTTTPATTTASTPHPTTLISTTTVTVPTRTRAKKTSPPPTTTETSTEVMSTTHRTTVVTTPLTMPPPTTETSTPVTTVPPPTTTSQSPSTTTTLPTSTKTTISTQSTTQTLPHTSTTVTTATQSTTHLSTIPTHSKTTPTTTTQAPSTSTKGTTGSPSTVGTSTLAPSTPTATSTTACEPVCTWSKWLDVDFPTSGPSDGDIETYHNIRAAGEKICGQPTHIECRAENFPNISIHNVGQKVSCDINFGLVCKNEEQVGKFEICFNYQVRVRCCTPNPICSSTPTTPSTTSGSTPPPTTLISTTTVTVPTKTRATETSSPPTTTVTTATQSTTHLSTIPTHSKTTPTTTTQAPSTSTKGTTGSPSTVGTSTLAPSTTTATSTTACEPVCTWSKWLDVDFPTSGPSDGDIETYHNIRAAGEKICGQPTHIECRAENFPNISIHNVGQKVSCDINFGLVCKNEEQVGKFEICFNYQVRVRCCTPNPICSSTPTTPSTTSGSTPPPTTLISTTTVTVPTKTRATETSSPPTSTETSTEFISTTHRTTAVTTPVTTPPRTTETSTPVTTVPPPTTTSQSPSTTTTLPTSTNTTISTQSTTQTLPHTSTTVTTATQSTIHLSTHPTHSKTTPTTTTQSPSTSTKGTTASPSTVVPSTPAPSTTTTTATTACEQVCTWSKWFDVDSPYSGAGEGDIETYQNIRAAGEKICAQPADIECRAENQQDISINQVEQVVLCDVHFGLVCKNKDQTGKFNMCYNYQIRVFCLGGPTPNCTSPTTTPVTTTGSTPPPTTLISTTTVTVPTRTRATETSSPPTSTETSTEVSSTTHHTTVVTTPLTTPPPMTETSTPVTTVPPPTTTSETPSTTTTLPTSTKTTISTQSTTRTLPHTSTTVTTATQSTTHLSTHPTHSKTTPTTTPQAPSTSTKGTRASPSTVRPSTPSPSTATTTSTSTATTACEPICTWGKWLDVDFPSTEPGDGDWETFHNIRAAGVSICGQPADIECRAENFPNISIQNIGQVVRCDVSFGFVCKNEEQVGKFRICFNYQVRIMCCEEIPKCPSTTTIPETTAVSTPSMSVITSRTTTPRACHCQVRESLYQPGEVIYNTTDSDGCVFYAICTSNCSVSRFQERCNTSTPATTTPATTILPTVTASTIITPPTGCQKVKPHRKNGETWNPSNCTIAKCENNTVVVENKYCPPAREITCANGYPPVLVTDETGCCHHYECQCTCSGWGDPHYITFDGTYYTFLQNCTYVLVKQIIPVYDNFRVYIDNYFCDAKAGLSCPKAIIIFYKSAKIVLTREAGSGAQANKIYFNGELVEPGLNQDGILIAMRGIQMIAEIPEIGAIVTFNGYVFSIQLPYSKFGNNTEGQCGTCTNNKSDECRLPDGQIISSCPKMAYHWKVSDNQTCLTPPPIITTPPPFSCEPSSPCKVILSKVFEECHKVIPPEPFYKGCVFDECRMRKPSILCSSLELYAFWCASRGVCIDWRNETNGTCPFTCPAGTVYKACGPLNPQTCDPRDIQLSSIGLTEGCFCPKGKTFLNSDSKTCVPGCICVAPGGESKAPGTTWESDCQDCFCDNSTVEVHCEPRKCPQVSKVSCDKAGYIPVKIWTKDDKCCPSTECRCNVSFCPESIKTCEAGYESHIEMLEGSCCSVLRCTVPPGCLLNGTVYPPGMSWYLPGNNCTSYECKENNHHFLVVTRNKSCAALNPEDCGPEGVTLSADGCCKVCSTLPKGCKLLNTTTVISQSECTATVPIELTYCEGNCPASSIYSAEANMMEHKCKCCQEVKTSKKHVTLQCRNGTHIDYSYIHVDECGCVGSQCIPQSSHTTPAQVQEQQQQEQIQQQQWQG
ncbi:LOW QUALITY PROTEIN: mucin-5AC [Alligator sinensis]|uniref:LOW QUALITY PROTEIN: mucin-5AC n=1 Tax=Alligator sinensis TaxID=38654 RepID=A0A3Q0GZT6_ALLSI|nr:LOW QUALITY PROTEIN: mucin-5AC [Alligator sinensis]